MFFDVDPWTEQQAETLTAIRRAHSTPRLVACAGFPHPQMESLLRDAGADAVWAKLSPLESLGSAFHAFKLLRVPR